MLRRFALGFVILAFLPAPAFAIGIPASEAHEFATAMDRLQGQLDELELFLMMPVYESKLDTGRCRTHIKDAEKHFKAAEALNKKYKAKPTYEYEGQMAEHKELNAFALENYKKCFTNEIIYSRNTDTPLFSRMRVADYYSFMSKKEYLSNKFQWSSGLAAHLAKLKEMMATLQSEGTDSMQRNTKVGVVRSVTGVAWLNHIGSERYSKQIDWKPLKVGDSVFESDHIQTGADTSVRVDFVSYNKLTDASPITMAMGPKSYIVVSKYLPGPLTEYNSATTGAMTLIRGAMRAFTSKFWGTTSGSQFQVRTGTSICGIRGTDITIVHNPEADSTEYLLDHGKVEIAAPSGSLMLQPRQKLAARAGKLGVPATLTAADESRRLLTKGRLQIDQGRGLLNKQ